MKVSIIVPVYNAEAYLGDCIQSILRQTMNDYELILTDDGSTDGSGRICDSYAAQDERVRVLHQSNQGHTAARLNGLRKAVGDYILFADSDDFLEPDMLAVMAGTAEQYHADIVQCNYFSGPAEHQTVAASPFAPGPYDRSGMTSMIIPSMLCYGSSPYRFGVAPNLWNKLFRRGLAEQFLPTVPAEIRNGEDGLFTYQCILASKLYFVLDKALYHYCSRPGSLSRRVDESRLRENHLLFQHYWSFMKDIDCLREQLCHYIVYQTEQYVSSALEIHPKHVVRQQCLSVWVDRNAPERISIRKVHIGKLAGKRNRLLLLWMKTWA